MVFYAAGRANNSDTMTRRTDAVMVFSKRHSDATIGLLLSEAIKTSAIEGEELDRESVRSSRHSFLMTSDRLPDDSDQKSAGAAWWLVDVRKSWKTSLMHELLGKWQSMAVPEQLFI
jgi:hypothetical protein